MHANNKAVWLFGSGCSKPLGAPLLCDFFGRTLEARIQAAVSVLGNDVAWAEKFAALITNLRAVYDGGLEEERINTRFQRGPWANAEEFLEYVDMAGAGDPAARALIQNALSHGKMEYRGDNRFVELAKDVRGYLAAACHFFVPEQSIIDSSERWAPHRRWGGQLLPQDHVISFNYDVVAERVRGKGKIALFGREHANAAGNWIDNILGSGSQLIKLHGSVSKAWALDEPNEPLPKLADVWTAIRERHRFEIAAPGPGKLAASKDYFKPHWQLARRAIESADVVTFVGYRIPETDSYACEQLVHAFGNHPKKSHLTVRIVLGPTRDRDVERLIRLLRWSGCHSARVIFEPLWAQDFFSVFDRTHLASVTGGFGG